MDLNEEEINARYEIERVIECALQEGLAKIIGFDENDEPIIQITEKGKEFVKDK